MGIVDRAVDDEPEEKPDQLGRMLIRVSKDYPDQWREVFETPNRATAVRIEGCLIGRGEGRIAGASDIEHWEARVVERVEKDQVVYAVRVRYSTKPHGKDWRSKPRVEKKPDPEAVIEQEHAALRAAAAATESLPPETERVSKGSKAPRDADEAAQAGLDLAAG